MKWTRDVTRRAHQQRTPTLQSFPHMGKSRFKMARSNSRATTSDNRHQINMSRRSFTKRRAAAVTWWRSLVLWCSINFGAFHSYLRHCSFVSSFYGFPNSLTYMCFYRQHEWLFVFCDGEPTRTLRSHTSATGDEWDKCGAMAKILWTKTEPIAVGCCWTGLLNWTITTLLFFSLPSASCCLSNQGRDPVDSACEWGRAKIWKWRAQAQGLFTTRATAKHAHADEMGNMWRWKQINIPRQWDSHLFKLINTPCSLQNENRIHSQKAGRATAGINIVTFFAARILSMSRGAPPLLFNYILCVSVGGRNVFPHTSRSSATTNLQQRWRFWFQARDVDGDVEWRLYLHG